MKCTSADPFAASASSSAKSARAGGKRKKEQEKVLSEVASVLGGASCRSRPGTPRAPSVGGGTPCKSARSAVGSVLLDESDVEDEQGGINIQAILQGRMLGRSVRSVFCFVSFIHDSIVHFLMSFVDCILINIFILFAILN